MYNRKGEKIDNREQYRSLHPDDSQPTFLGKVKSLWAREDQLLPTSNGSPTISACTTATNLSSLEFQSSSTIFKEKMTTLRENLRRAEIEPLQRIDKETLNPSDDESDDNFKTHLEENVKLKCSSILPQLTAAVAVALVSFIIGYTSAYTSPAGKSLERDFNITEHELSWVSGFMALAATGGGFLGGPMIEYIGRKYTLLVTDLLFFVAWFVIYFAQSHQFLYASRLIAGCSVGIASLIFPVYLGETIQPEVRGTLGLLPTVFGNVGMLIVSVLGFAFEWKGLAGIGALLPIPFIAIFVWIIPETPQWYISKGRAEDSRKALQWLRGKDQNIDKEFNNLVQGQRKNSKKTKISDLINRTSLKPLLIILGLMFFQQMSGINAVISYTNNIFEKSGSHLEPNVCSSIVVTVNFISTFIATILIDRLGRKVLVYISAVSITITMAILGAYFYLMNRTDIDVSPYGWLPLATFVIYVLGFSLGFGPVPWLMMGEILPAKTRGVAGSIATAFNWLCSFVVTKSFFSIIQVLGDHGVFWLFSAMSLCALVFTITCVPETKGQSLEDIEKKLAGTDVRRTSLVDNVKAMPSNVIN